MEAAFNQDDRFQKQFRYHHGNLRETLVDAALEILNTEGLEALSLRSIARKSNVSQAAPYSHFRNKKDLVSAVAETGFQRLALQMANDIAKGNSARTRVENLILSYIDFAQNNKALFQLMFSNEIANVKDSPTLAMSAEKGRALMSAALLQSKSYNDEYMAVTIWGLCHGITDLIMSGKLDVAKSKAEDMKSFVTNIVSIFSDKL